MPFVGNVKNLLPTVNNARNVRGLRHRGDFFRLKTSMTHAFHIAANLPSPKRDAGLRACEWRMALPRNDRGFHPID